MELEYEVDLGNFEDVFDKELYSNESLLELETTYEKLLIKNDKITFNFDFLTAMLFTLGFSLLVSSAMSVALFSKRGLAVLIIGLILSLFVNIVFKGPFHKMGSYFYSLFSKNNCYEQISKIEGLFSEKVQSEIFGVVKQDLVIVNSLLIDVEMSKKELKKSKGLVKEIKCQIKYIKSMDENNKKIVVRGFFELNRLRKSLSKMIVKYQPKVVIEEKEEKCVSLVKSL